MQEQLRAMLGWRSGLALGVVVLSVAGCGGESASDAAGDGVGRVDCLGMAPYQVSGAPEGVTRLPVGGTLDIIPDASNPFAGKLAEGNRCWFRFTGPFEGRVGKIGFDTVDSGLIAVNLGGRAYVMSDGDITFDPDSRRARASGTYRGTFAPVSGGAGEPVELTGRFDYCHMPTEGDCPYAIDGLFDAPVTVTAPKLGRSVKAEASACRVLVDRATGSAQFDLEIGVWRGLNLGQLFDNCADLLNLPDYALINHNRLRFRVGGVSGPGTYGPYVAQTWDDGRGGEVVLPELEWKIPPAFAYLYTPAAAGTGVCLFLLQSGCTGFPCEGSTLRTVPGESQCTLTFDDAGRVQLRCDDIVTHVPNLPPLFERGDVEVEAACRVTYRP